MVTSLGFTPFANHYFVLHWLILLKVGKHVMDWSEIHNVFVYLQRFVSTCGILIIVSGVFLALAQYIYYGMKKNLLRHTNKINTIRLDLGRTLILGLEFIVAADLIGTTTTPDYYAVGLLAIIVAIRTMLTFSISRELASLRQE
jgi:uncharacterized membrane protein